MSASSSACSAAGPGPPPTIGEAHLAAGLVAATMPHRQGVVEHTVDAQPFAVLIYSRSERILRQPPARGMTGRKVSARSVSFLPAGLPSRWRYASPIFEHDRSRHVLHLRFMAEFAQALELAPDQFLHQPAPTLDIAVAGLARKMELALRAYESRDPLAFLALQSAGFAAAERFFGAAVPAISPSTLTPQRRRALADYVENTAVNELSISAMADLVGLSSSHFYRVFKASTGQTPLRWALDRRRGSRRQAAS